VFWDNLIVIVLDILGLSVLISIADAVTYGHPDFLAPSREIAAKKSFVYLNSFEVRTLGELRAKSQNQNTSFFSSLSCNESL